MPGEFPNRIREEMVKMTVVYFHRDFLQHYAPDPAASPGRLEPSVNLLEENYSFVQPTPGTPEEVLRVHDSEHLERIAWEGEMLYQTALLALGATRDAAFNSMEGETSFALCRPPGHHAGRNSCWGFCYFNNVAAAVAALLDTTAESVRKVLVVDFDLHFGDGTRDIFKNNPSVIYWHGRYGNRREYLNELSTFLGDVSADVLAVSAGFDRHARDWGGMLTTEDYREIGKLLGNFALRECDGRVFSALEGGYNSSSLAESIDAFLDGLQNGKEGR